MSKPSRTDSFVDLCVRGEALVEEIDDFVERWHEGDEAGPLRQFLGMTAEEYNEWVVHPDVLPLIVAAHKLGLSLSRIMDLDGASYRMAARARSADELSAVIAFLKRKGIVD